MRYLQLVLCFITVTLLPDQLFAQSLERQVISSFGAEHTSPSLSLYSTAGETITETAITGSFHLTQGYQQPTQKELSVAKKVMPLVKYTLYPNPANDRITLRLETPVNTTYRFVIYAVTGQAVAAPVSITTDTHTYKQQFNLSAYAPGNYYLTITSAEGQLYKTIPFTKN